MIPDTLKTSLKTYADSLSPSDQSSHAQNVRAISTHWQQIKQGSNTSGWLVHPSRREYLRTISEITHKLDERTVIIAPNRYVMGQIRESLETAGVRSDDIGAYHSQAGKRENNAALKKKILIITPSLFSKLTRKGELSADAMRPEYRPLIFFDGVQKGKASRIKTILSPYINESTVLGFTSQDKASDGETIGSKVFGDPEPIHKTDLQAAVDGREAPVTRCVVLESNHKPGVQIEGGRDYTDEERDQMLNPIVTRRAISRLHRSYVDPETGIAFKTLPAVVYCNGIKDAERTAKHFNRVFGKGTAACVTSDLPDEVRDQKLKEFKDGDLRVLVTSELTLHGLDAPKTAICYMKRATRSATVAGHSGYGVTENDPADPHKQAFVVTCINARVPDQVSFPQVAGGEEFKPLISGPSTVKRNQDPAKEPEPKIRGMRIISKAYEVRTFMNKRDVGQRMIAAAKKYVIEYRDEDVVDFVETLQALRDVKSDIRNRNNSLAEFAAITSRVEKLEAVKTACAQYERLTPVADTFFPESQLQAKLNYDPQTFTATPATVQKLIAEMKKEMKIRKGPLLWVQGVDFEKRFVDEKHGALRFSRRAMERLDSVAKRIQENPLDVIDANAFKEGGLYEHKEFNTAIHLCKILKAMNQLNTAHYREVRDVVLHLPEVRNNRNFALIYDLELCEAFKRNNPLFKPEIVGAMTQQERALLEPVDPNIYRVEPLRYYNIDHLISSMDRQFPGYVRLDAGQRQAAADHLKQIYEDITQEMHALKSGVEPTLFHIGDKAYPMGQCIYAGLKNCDRTVLVLRQDIIPEVMATVAERMGFEVSADEKLWTSEAHVQPEHRNQSQRKK